MKQSTVKKVIIVLIGIIGLAYAISQLRAGAYPVYSRVETITDLKQLFPLSAIQIRERVQASLDDLKKEIDALLAIDDSSRTFANTAKKLDQITSLSNAMVLKQVLWTLEVTSPDERLRTVCHDLQITMQDFFIEHLANNVELYQAFKAYAHGAAPKENLDEKQRYFIDETLKGFEHAGLGMPEGVRAEIKRVQKELATLCLQFETNIDSDTSKVLVDESELEGVTQSFKSSLAKEGDQYVLSTQFPVYLQIMEQCTVAQTRKKMYKAYNQRAYPSNDVILKEIIAKRDELARLLDKPSYATYDLEDQMVKTPERAREFLTRLLAPAVDKAGKELEVIARELPSGVTRNPDGTFNPWDIAYLLNWYKKTHLSVDEQKVAEYFPAQQTIAGLLGIYEKFFSLQFKQESLSGLWTDELIVLSVYRQGEDQLLGYFILDLYPRPFKYGHACHNTLIPSTFDESGKPNVAVSIVIANFPRATADKPALFDRKYVETFFHEFGHALHALLGRTHIASFAGTNVKTDFVELPSQMLEEWLEDREILRMLSSHYQTGEPLAQEMIDRILTLSKVDAGLFLSRQLFYALLSLDLFAPGADKDPYQLSKQLFEQTRPFVQFDKDDRTYASFGHLTGYGAKYYSYLWSKVFALDLFETIKTHGLLNPHIGDRYVRQVIGQGGSVDPDQLLIDFLGRKPSERPFLRYFGLSL